MALFGPAGCVCVCVCVTWPGSPIVKAEQPIPTKNSKQTKRIQITPVQTSNNDYAMPQNDAVRMELLTAIATSPVCGLIWLISYSLQYFFEGYILAVF